MKDKVNQMFKDKLFLVMMVIGLLTAVAAVGVLTVSNTDEKGQSPYLEEKLSHRTVFLKLHRRKKRQKKKFLRSKRQRYHRKITHKKKRKIQTPRMILQQKQVQENRQPKPWY